MSYKTILTVVTGETTEASALETATQFTAVHDAHLEILSLGVDHSQPGFYYAGANALIEQETLDRARKQAATTEEAVRKAMAGDPCRWSVDSAVAQIGTISHFVGQRARFSDLVILPRPYGDTKNLADEAVLEAALFDGASPVLVMPAGTTFKPPKHIVLAWNESAEALGAIRAALPLLRAAELTNIVVIDPPAHSADRSDPGGRLSQMLARQGVRVEISVIAATMPRTADVLARHVQDQNADLLVMGAYGHSRFREAILGGATRDMLENCTGPVFMGH